MPEALTPRQREILDYIAAHVREHGYPPTVRGIGAHAGIRSPNGVHGHLKALARKGFIKHVPYASRGITLLGERTRDQSVQKLVEAARLVLERCKVTAYEEQVAHSLLAKALEPFGRADGTV